MTSLSKEERLDRLTEALGGYVNDEPLQLGSSSQTVWDVSSLMSAVVEGPL